MMLRAYVIGRAYPYCVLAGILVIGASAAAQDRGQEAQASDAAPAESRESSSLEIAQHAPGGKIVDFLKYIPQNVGTFGSGATSVTSGERAGAGTAPRLD